MKAIIKVFTAAAVCVAAQLTRGATVNWTNALGGQFGNGTNWSSNPNVPGASDDVYFQRGNAAYSVDFDSPAVNPTNNTMSVANGDNVTFNLGSQTQTYNAMGNLNVSGNAGTRLAVNGGTVNVGNHLYLSIGNGSWESFSVSNGASVYVATNFMIDPYGNSTSLVVITDSSTRLESGGKFYFGGGAAASTCLIDNAASLITRGSEETYLTSLGTNNDRAVMIVDHGATWTITNALIRLGPYSDNGGRLIVRGSNSWVKTRQITVNYYGHLSVASGAEFRRGKPENIYLNNTNCRVSGAGKFTRGGDMANSYQFDVTAGTVAPGDDNTPGTLTLEDVGNLWMRDVARLEVRLGGTTPGQYGCLLLTNSAAGNPNDRGDAQFYTGNSVKVIMHGDYKGAARAGDTFDLLNCQRLKNGSTGAWLSTNDAAFPSLSFADSRFEGDLSLASNNQILRLTLTKVLPSGVIVKIY